MFIVQEAVHVAAIEEDLIQAGLAARGDFNIREIDAARRTVGVLDVGDLPAADRIARG